MYENIIDVLDVTFEVVGGGIYSVKIIFAQYLNLRGVRGLCANHSGRASCLSRMCLRRKIFIELLPSNGCICHNIFIKVPMRACLFQ